MQPPPSKPAHPPELRFQEERRHNSSRNLILSYKQSKLQAYDPIMREVLSDALLSMEERITTLEERMCFFESSGAILQKPHMNVEEVARYLGYTPCSIYNLTRRKQIPFHKIKRHIFFDKKEIDDLLMKPENATNMELVTEYTSLMQKLDEENDNWLVLSEELEEVSGQ